VDKRSDLFSLGAILYRMVTGYGPFQGNSATTVCFKVANRDPIRATALDPDLPPEVDSLVARAMAKDPSQRYQRGLDFALDLHEVRQRLSKGSKGGLQFTKTGEPIVPPVIDDVTYDSSASRLSLSSAENPAPAAVGAPSLVPPQAPTWWRTPAVRLWMASSVAITLFGVLAFQHFRSSRLASQTGAPAAVGVAAVPIPLVSNAGSNVQGARKVLNVKIPARTVADSRLDIHIEHRFSEADLSLWIDNKLAFEHTLKAQSKKHWNPFRVDVRETESVHLSAGEHSIRIRVRSLPDQFDQSSTILGSFANDHPALLQINFERQRKAMRLSLR
jgi:serine/threonine-protein kinase